MNRRFVESALCAAALLACILFVGPRGEFPLNDDWNFALTTWKFVDSGEFVYSRFTAMTLKLQVLWGALWTIALGKSHEVLRFSSLALFVLSTVVVNRWLARLGVDGGMRVVATAAFAFHPVLFWSAFTFMTQVPFLFCSVLALWAFHRGLDDDDARYALLGAAAIVGAFFIRQTGVVLALAPTIAILRQRETLSPRWRRLLAVALSPVALFTMLIVFTNALRGYPGQILEHFVVWKVPLAELPAQVMRVAGYYSFFNFQNAGLFLLPLTLLLPVWLARDKAGRIIGAGSVAVFAAGAAHMILRGYPMPYWSDVPKLEVHPGNILVNLGLGPLTLRDTWTLDMEPPFSAGYGERTLLTLVAAILGGIVVAALIRSWTLAKGRSRPERCMIEMSVVHCVAATGALFVSGIYFDRYVVDSLWTLALLIPVVVGSVGRPARVLAAVATILVATFSLLATQEYLRWNGARWQAFSRLQAEGISMARMDGGYEINQFLVGGFDGPILLKRSGFSVVDPEYILTFNRVPGYTVVSEDRFESFLGRRRGAVLTLRRVDGAQP
ncbi:MAG: ArnT family glycosyltransferase [Thermoanaerobaculia bacterium]